MFVVSAAGCTELLEGTGYRHGQIIEGTLDDALWVIRELHERGLDIMLARMKIPFVLLGPGGLDDRTEYHGVRGIYVAAVNWFELGGQKAHENP